jgi:4-hydroxy-3-polyprenylbenzoate decarboxylase
VFDDLRDFLKKAEEIGMVNVLEGADWDLEIGRITEMQLSVPDAPLLLFDKIKGYQPGYRIVTNFEKTERLINMAFDFPLEAKGIELVKLWRERFKEEIRPIPPVEVKTGPVMENVFVGDKVDLLKFPAPRWAELDGGRYIGTGDLVIEKDPDEGWINMGTYRVQVHDKNTATIFISPGKHGDVIRRKYWERGQSCPVAVVTGVEPVLFSTGLTGIPWGLSEYDYAGGLKGKPVEVVRGKTTDLLIPAGAEIVLEGELLPPGVEDREEGPFGEYTGFYASGARNEPAFRVNAVMHRNEPIITGRPPQIGKYNLSTIHVAKSTVLWNELDKRVPGVTGVWCFHESGAMGIIAISVKQMYAGHAKSAGLFAAGLCTEAESVRWIIVLDDDLDPSNSADVLWALGQRCDPKLSVEVISGLCTNPLSTTTPPDMRARKNYLHSRAIVMACRPYDWMNEFPKSIKSSSEVMKKIREKWGKFLYGQ